MAATITLSRPSAWKLLVLAALTLVSVQGQMDENYIEWEVVEEQPSSTLVGNIVSSSGLDQRYSSATLRNFSYEFLASNNVYNSYFVIENSGLLRTSQTIDRDRLCSHMARCEIKLDIAVKPVQYFQIIKVKIRVLDINDNWPTFQDPRVTLAISETTVPGATFALPVAEDRDSASLGIQSYQLQPGSGAEKFSLRVTNGTEPGESPTDVHLVLKERLDREDRAFYSLVLVAYDGGIPRKSGAVTVDVSVMDANDNTPRFTNQTYEVYVFENVAVSTTIATVHAVDDDDGENGQIVYSLSRSAESEYGDLFGINEHTGEVYVLSELDYEQAEGEYILGLVARDQGPNSLAAYAKLKIHVWDVNDHAPQITVNSLTASGGAQISEHAKLNTFVTHISVTDPDSGQNGAFTCSIDDDHFLLEQIYQKEYKIITAARFDREIQDTYNVNLICHDQATTDPKTSSEVIVISILDENDHAPEFPQETYFVSFRENNTLGDVIIQVNATDKDIGTNAQIEYSIIALGNYGDSLQIDPVSGVVRANMVFDHEVKARYKYRLVATDKGQTSLNSTATLSFSVTDINDNPPIFQRRLYKFGTFENQAAGTEIGTVVAQDKDGPQYNQVTYSLDYLAGDGAEVFTVDRVSGTIRTQRVLDRETRGSYSIVVVARNYGYPLSSQVNVTIDVADKNDNAPIILYPIDDNETVQVASTAKLGSVVSHVEAFDLDFGQNADLRYEIVSGDKYGLFEIHPIEGSLLVKKALGRYVNHYFNVAVLVSDQGDQPMSAFTQLRVFINGTAAALGRPRGLGGLDDNIVVIIVATVFALVLVTAILLIIVLLRRRQVNQRHHKYNHPSHAHVTVGTVTMEKPPQPSVTVEGNGSMSRKEVKFHRNDEVIQNRGFFENGHWPQGTDPNFIQDPHGHSTPLTSPHLPSDAKYPEHPSYHDLPPPPFREDAHHRLYYLKGAEPPRGQGPSAGNGGNNLAELQAQDLLELLPAPPGDGGSDRGSLTDSGRGPSEEGDHLQHSPMGDVLPNSPQRAVSPKHPSPQPRNPAPQPTKFTIYPCSPTKKPKHLQHLPTSASNCSLPTKHHHGNQLPWRASASHGNLHEPDTHSPCHGSKPMVPPRTSSISKPPALPPKAPRLQTFCPIDNQRPRREAPSAGSRHSLDCPSDDGTTTSGSYVVDLTEVEEADNLEMSGDVVV